MSAVHIPALLGEGAVAHRTWVPPPKAAKIKRGGYVHGLTACGEEGWLKPALSTSQLCQRCFKGDRRTVGEWEAANQPKKAAVEGLLLGMEA